MKRIAKITGISITLLILQLQVKSQGFMHAEGKYIVDKDGAPFISRSMGIGGWMLQEGYHMKTAGLADTQHEIEEKLVELTSDEFKDIFYESWLTNHFTKRDIDSLKAWGFNSIRPALHYKWFTPPVEEEPVQGEITWCQKGFELLDSLIKWCTEKEMYLFLDLHAAPGSQGYNASISDYDPEKPSLWESEYNKRKTAMLWKKIAERCKHEPWVGGYDLINETNWTFEGNFDEENGKNGCSDSKNTPLRNLLEEITDSIRIVDKNHMIIIEGNCWANNFAGLTPPWDENLVYSFHKYWNPNTTNAIQEFLDLRETFNVPIWLGETGENSNTWFTNCIQLMESHQIGWSWWTLKQLNDIDDPFIIPSNTGYEKVLKYWGDEGNKPTTKEVEEAFLQLAEDSKTENCIVHKDVIDAMFRQTKTDDTKPFKTHNLPGVIYATDYDMGKVNHAWYDVDYTNTDFNTTTNQGGLYRNDGVDIERCEDETTNGFNVGWIESGEWLQYTFDVRNSGNYHISVRAASKSGEGQVSLEFNDNWTEEITFVPATGGWQQWVTIDAGTAYLQKGRNTLVIKAEAGGFNLNYIQAWQTTNIHEEKKTTQLKLIQNGSQIKVRLPEEFDISLQAEVYDISGRAYNLPFSREGKYLVFSSETLGKGIYYLRVQSDFLGTAKFYNSN